MWISRICGGRRVRHRDVDQLVEAAGAQQRRVEERRPVGRADHDDALQLLEPVHLGEEGVDHALGDRRLADPAAAARRERVDLVDEDDRRGDLAGAGEQPAHLLLALAVPLGEQVARLRRDEVGLGLAGDGLGQQRLAGAGRAVEQEALGRADAEPAERLGVLERQLDALAQRLLRLVEPADVVPADVRDLDHDLAHRARLDALDGLHEVVPRDDELVEHLGRDLALLEVDLGQVAAERLDGGLARERREVGADEAVGHARELVEVDVLGERHAARVDVEDLAAARLVGHADDDLAVEPAGPAQRLVDGVEAGSWRR